MSWKRFRNRGRILHGGLIIPAVLAAASLSAGPPTRTEALSSLSGAAFEPNVGQAPVGVDFVARLGRQSIALSASGAWIQTDGNPVGVRPVGSLPSAKAEGVGRLTRRAHYFRGADRSQWRSDVPSFAGVRYRGVYAGIDLLYHSHSGQLEYDFIVKPGADPGAIVVEFPGTETVRVDDYGGVTLNAGSARQARHRPPTIYQETASGRTLIAGRFADAGERSVRFQVSDYDRRRPLVIDPIVEIATVLGGAGSERIVDLQATDSGVVFALGETTSTDFPTPDGGTAKSGADADIFLARLQETFTIEGARWELTDVAFLGGSAAEKPLALLLDQRRERVIVLGDSRSTDFPTAGARPFGAFLGVFQSSGAALTPERPYGAQIQDCQAGCQLGTVVVFVDANGSAPNRIDPATSGFNGSAVMCSVDGPAPAVATVVSNTANQVAYQGFTIPADGTPEPLNNFSPNLPNGAQVSVTATEDCQAIIGVAQVSSSQDIFATVSYTGFNVQTGAPIPGSTFEILTDGDNVALKGGVLDESSQDFCQTYVAEDLSFLANGFDSGSSSIDTMVPNGRTSTLFCVNLGGNPNRTPPFRRFNQIPSIDGEDYFAIAARNGLVRLPNNEIGVTGEIEEDVPQVALPPVEIPRQLREENPAGAGPARNLALWIVNQTTLETREILAVDAPSDERTGAIAVNSLGDVFLGGSTQGGFPTSPGTPQGTGGGSDAVIVKIAGIAISVSADGVVGAADFLTGPVSPGQILSVFGARVGASRLVVAELDSESRFPRELAGVRVLFNGEPAPIVFSIRGQTNVIAPFSIAGKSTVELQVELGGVLSEAVTLEVAAARPGIFSATQTGVGQAALLNQDFSVNSAANPAAPGSVVQIFLTGGGALSQTAVDGGLVPAVAPFPALTQDVAVRIGGQEAQIAYAGAAPGLVFGVIQINAFVPAGLPADAAATLEVEIGGVKSQPGVTLALGE
jgi:uncharacterized protein (TIGR03437 family)